MPLFGVYAGLGAEYAPLLGAYPLLLPVTDCPWFGISRIVIVAGMPSPSSQASVRLLYPSFFTTTLTNVVDAVG